MKERIAIYGGSFDPPHLGHLAVMKEALARLPIDRLIVVPAYISPFKKGHAAPPELRLKWLRRLAAFDPRIEVSDYEIAKKGPSYTIETVRHFLPEAEKIYLIVGADNLEGLKRWHRFDELDRLVTWVVATRGEKRVPPGFLKLDVRVPVSSTQLREKLDPEAIPEAIRREVVQFYTQESRKERD
ncbi:nicotinate (nicotinamide) nucleotide adenylyltransferase [Hydrogenimonas sp.]